jgi:hypothetical protein
MRLRGLAVLALATLAGCGHSEPFQPLDTTTDQPFRPGAPTRLTYNAGKDLRPAWLPDGSGFVYAWQQIGQPNKDRCLGIMSATGGTRVQTICNPDPTSADSLDLFDSPSPSPDGRILYIRGSSPPSALAPSWAGVFAGPLSDPLAAVKLLNLPFTPPGDSMQGHISHARWVSSTRVMFLGEQVDYIGVVSKDTVVTGRAIIDMDLSGPTPTISSVPGTSDARSLDLTSNRDTLVYTLAFDTRVYARALATGQVSVLHDFGARGPAQEATIRGNQLVAVVGVRPEGGVLVSVDLSTGTEALIPGGGLYFFRQPAFSPVGSPPRLIAEGYTWSSVVIMPGLEDTLVSKNGDIYLYEAP